MKASTKPVIPFFVFGLCGLFCCHANHLLKDAFMANSNQIFPSLENLTQTSVKTEQAAFYLMRSAQTLRVWAMGKKKTPITPTRINGRLAWSVADIRCLLGVQ